MQKAIRENILEKLSMEVLDKRLDPYSAKDEMLKLIKQ